MGSCIAISNFDDVAIEMSRCCRQFFLANRFFQEQLTSDSQRDMFVVDFRNIRGLDLWRAKTLTATGVRAIAESCPRLEEIDLGWW